MVGYPIDYGDNLTPEQAFKNFKGHSKEVAVTLAWMIILGTFSASAEDPLVGSVKSKSGPGPAPTTLGIPRPKTPMQRAVNTGAIGLSIGVLCLNAMWIPAPIAVGICLAALTGYVVPPAWSIIIRGIRAGAGGG